MHEILVDGFITCYNDISAIFYRLNERWRYL